MTPTNDDLAKSLIIDYNLIIGDNCEHSGYCDKTECNDKLEYTVCNVDYKASVKCAIRDLQNRIDLLNELEFDFNFKHGTDKDRILKSKISELELQKSALDTL